MVSHFQNPIFDALYCEEERTFDDGFILKDPEIKDFNEIQQNPFVFFEHDLSWDDDEVKCLLSKEKKQARLIFYDVMNSDGSLKMLRNDAVKWMLSVIGYYGFSALTAVLAVNYYDRYITSLCFQKDKPWMSQLAAVACLSIAAKVEETHVPLLLDLQVVECKYLFESKTIQRMELLVLTSLKWKMNPVTPMSYFDHFGRRFGIIKNLHWDFVRRCESVILLIITDCRLVHYHPSVIACATMIYVIREIKIGDAFEYQNRIMNVLETSKEMVDDCHKLIVEAMMDVLSRKSCHKRKYLCIPNSPIGVIDAYFSSDSSVDSWAVGSLVSSSPEPFFKRSRGQDKHMRLAPMVGLANRTN